MYSIRRSLCLFLSNGLLSSAIDSRDKWSSVYNTTLYNALPSCAQPCLSGVDISLNCWSYGCVCSENTPGENFVNGTIYIETCVLKSCQQLADATLDSALGVFQSLCGVSYFKKTLPTGTVLESATITSAAIPTATFDSKNAVIVDKPENTYNALEPCVRWVLNNCKGEGDSDENCKPRLPGDHSELWSGLGVATQCTNAECLCGGTRFYYSTQKLYDAANYFCSIGFPTQENATNPTFVDTIQMLADYCSQESGFMLREWIVSLIGYVPNKGMTQETRVAIGVGVGSGVLTIISIVIG